MSNNKNYRCTECGYCFGIEIENQEDVRFCPQCGAERGHLEDDKVHGVTDHEHELANEVVASHDFLDFIAEQHREELKNHIAETLHNYKKDLI